jgi:FHS family L-fucose permease-like MFS transporter
LFYPAAATRLYPLFLLALFVVAGGITILQVAANPYISVLGPDESASARLNLSQAFNSFGTTVAPVVAASFLLGDQILSGDAIEALAVADRQAYFAGEASAVQVPFVMLALAFFLLAGVVGVIKLPKILGSQDGKPKTDYSQVFQNKKLRFGALAIFVYVGAEVALGSYMVSYGLSLDILEDIQSNGVLSAMAGVAAFIKGIDVSGLDAKGVLGALLTFYWGGAMLGRFAGSGLMRWVSPSRLLMVAGLCAVVLIGVSISSSGVIALLYLLGVGFFNSIMFPTIFTLAIEDLGEGKPQGSGLLCTAIVGGAFIPPAVGALADGGSFEMAFLLPMLCYVYIAWFAGRLVPRAS